MLAHIRNETYTLTRSSRWRVEASTRYEGSRLEDGREAGHRSDAEPRTPNTERRHGCEAASEGDDALLFSGAASQVELATLELKSEWEPRNGTGGTRRIKILS